MFLVDVPKDNRYMGLVIKFPNEPYDKDFVNRSTSAYRTFENTFITQGWMIDLQIDCFVYINVS